LPIIQWVQSGKRTGRGFAEYGVGICILDIEYYLRMIILQDRKRGVL
jgi:hypothetical protein